MAWNHDDVAPNRPTRADDPYDPSYRWPPQVDFAISEAARYGMARKAIRSARLALGRAFSGRLRYILDGGAREKAEALIFMCPLTSKALNEDENTLEAAGVDVTNAAEAIRLGFHALTGGWRSAPNVEVERCKIARVWSANSIPALLDGETVRLKSLTEIRYIPKLARILALPKDPA